MDINTFDFSYRSDGDTAAERQIVATNGPIVVVLDIKQSGGLRVDPHATNLTYWSVACAAVALEASRWHRAQQQQEG